MPEEIEPALPGRFERPRQVRLAPTLAGRVVAIAAVLFLGFDLFVLGRLGFGGCFLSSWCLVTAYFTWSNLRGLEASAEFPREVSVGMRFPVQFALRNSRAARDLLLCSGQDAERLPVVEAGFSTESGAGPLAQSPRATRASRRAWFPRPAGEVDLAGSVVRGTVALRASDRHACVAAHASRS